MRTVTSDCLADKFGGRLEISTIRLGGWLCGSNRRPLPAGLHHSHYYISYNNELDVLLQEIKLGNCLIFSYSQILKFSNCLQLCLWGFGLPGLDQPDCWVLADVCSPGCLPLYGPNLWLLLNYISIVTHWHPNEVVLYQNALHFTVLHITVQHFTVEHFSALHCTVELLPALHCPALPCTTLHCRALTFPALLCTALHYTALHFSALNSIVEHFTTL